MSQARGPIAQLCDRWFLRLLAEIPEQAMLFDVGESEGLEVAADAVTDHSPQGAEHRAELVAQAHAELCAVDLATAGVEERLHHDVFRAFLEHPTFEPLVGHAGRPFLFHNHPVNPVWGVQSELLLFLALLHPLRHQRDADALLARLGQVPELLAQLGSSLRLRRDRGIVAPRFLLEQVLTEISTLVSTEPRQSLLLRALKQRLGGSESWRPELVLESARDLLACRIYPAYRQLAQELEGLAGHAPEVPGVWAMPDGDAYYDYQLRCETATQMSADEVHQLGLEETARLQGEIRDAFEELGLGRAIGKDSPAITELYATLATRDGSQWSDDDSGRAQLLARCEQLVEGAWSRLDEVFHLRPRALVVVQPTPKLLEASRPSTCYPPARDGSRPGIFEVNVGQEIGAPTWELPTLVYHEAIPGHHLQFAIAQESEQLPLFRRTLVFHSYIEGWAKYAEGLPWDWGLNRDPYWRLGSLRRELYSTVNLALDTGIHHLRWSREQGARFFREHTGAASEFAQAIVDRVAAIPAQTCSYKVGLLELRRLRDLSQERMGAGFTLPHFHDAVLSHGAMPFELLESVLERELTSETAVNPGAGSAEQP